MVPRPCRLPGRAVRAALLLSVLALIPLSARPGRVHARPIGLPAPVEVVSFLPSDGDYALLSWPGQIDARFTLCGYTDWALTSFPACYDVGGHDSWPVGPPESGAVTYLTLQACRDGECTEPVRAGAIGRRAAGGVDMYATMTPLPNGRMRLAALLSAAPRTAAVQSYRGRSGTAGLAAPGCPVVNVGEMCGPFDVEVPGALAGIGTSMAGGAEAGVTFQSREAPTVAFMFDDGTGIVQNGRYAMQDVLDQYGVKGSFFLTGRAMQTYPSAVRALVAGGHRVGNHTWSHPYLTRLGDAAIGAELDQAEAQFRAIVPGATTRPCFRAPNGDLNARVLAVADGRGYREIAQDVSSNDWAGVSAARMIDSVLREVRDGARVSFHSQEPQTLIALRTLVPTLLAEGYQFVTAC